MNGILFLDIVLPSDYRVWNSFIRWRNALPQGCPAESDAGFDWICTEHKNCTQKQESELPPAYLPLSFFGKDAF